MYTVRRAWDKSTTDEIDAFMARLMLSELAGEDIRVWPVIRDTLRISVLYKDGISLSRTISPASAWSWDTLKFCLSKEDAEAWIEAERQRRQG
jgi:hypothetical protein